MEIHKVVDKHKIESLIFPLKKEMNEASPDDGEKRDRIHFDK